MQTPMVVNPVNVLSGSAPTARPETSAAPAVPFKQVLTREVSARQPHNESKPIAARQAPANAPAKQNQPHKAENKLENKANKDGVSASEKNTRASEEDAAATEETAATASAELLALVANLGQVAVKASDSEAKADAGTAIKTDADQPVLVDPSALAVAGSLVADLSKGQPVRPDQTIQADAAAGNAALGQAGQISAAASLATTGKTTAAGTEQKDDIAAGGPRSDSAPRLAVDTGAVDSKSVQAQSKNEAGFQLDLTAAKKQEALLALAAAQDKPPVMSDVAMAPIQQAALNGAQAIPASDKLTAQVGSPAWDQALGQKIVWMVAGAQQSASLTLNPPDLGPLQVVLNVSNDQASATFIAAQPEVREALEAAMPRLREMLNEAGIQLGQANVNAQAQGQQQGSGEQQRQQQQQRLGQRSGQFETPVSAVRSSAQSSGSGLVDTFA